MKELLGDVLDALNLIYDYVDDRQDISDGSDGQPMPNTAMRLVQILEGNDYEHGLLMRVEEAWKASRKDCDYMRREG